MIRVSMREAKARLSLLVQRARAGERVVIECDGTPWVELTQLLIPVASGRLVLGTWQGIYLFEHRRRPHRREIVLHLMGE